jgi:hypothetical protein
MKCIDQMPVPIETAPPINQYPAAVRPRDASTREAMSRAT